MTSDFVSNNSNEEISRLLHDANRVLIISHIRPDGDAIGSLLGLGLTLVAGGKSVEMVLRDGIPLKFRYLPGADRITSTPSMAHDTFIVVDSGDLYRIGFEHLNLVPDLQIDHHATNPCYGRLNFVMPDEAATCIMLAEMLPKWGFSIPVDAAVNLMTGILTDTIGFRTSSTNANALRQAANLVDLGVDLPAVTFEALVKLSFENARYWGRGLTSLQRKDTLVWAVVTPEDRAWADFPSVDDGDLSAILSSIQDADISVLFNVHGPTTTKVSWRSKPGFDVSLLANSFGGGGHTAAAGADLDLPLDQAMELVLAATERKILEVNQTNLPVGENSKNG